MGFQDAIDSHLSPNIPTSGAFNGPASYYVPNAGLFGTGANLPRNSGPPDPFVGPTPLPGTQNYPSPAPNVNYAAYPPPGYGNILSLLDRYGVGGGGPSSSSQPSGGGGGPGYVPSDIMQAYLDFYANNPSASGATAPPMPGSYPSGGGGPEGTYPAPGAANRQQPSIIQRILGLHPASMIGKAIRDAIAANQTQSNMQSNPGSFQGPPAIPPGGALFGYNPNSGGGGGTRSYNYGTGAVTTSPSSNPLYSTGGVFQPVSGAPVDIRFSQNSGTGNWMADQTTKAFELSGGYPGGPNRLPNGTTDAGHTIFYPNAGTPRGYADPEQGVVTPAGGTFGALGHWAYPASNSFAYPSENPFSWMTPASISPPPLIGGGG